MVSDDRVDQLLRGAGRRARDDQPDAADARAAYQRRRSLVEPIPPTRRAVPRRTVPVLIGAGLIAAAVVGIVVGTWGRPSDNTSPPIDTAPDLTPTIVSDTVDDQTAVSTTTLLASSPCDRTRAPDDTGDVVIVNCRRGDDGEEAALVAQVPAGDALTNATRWFVEYAPLSNEPVELYFPAPVNGISNTISFVRDFESGLHCVVLVEQVLGGEWREACWLDTPVTQVVSSWNGSVVQFDLNNPRAVIAHVLDGKPLTSSGCRSDALTAVIAAAERSAVVFDGLGCIEDTAVLHEPWTRMQPGPPEGALRHFTRNNDQWAEDLSTDTTAEYAFAVPEYAAWTSRTTNEPAAVAYDIEALNNRPVPERADPTLIATLAAQVISDDTGISINQWVSDENGTFIEIPIIDPADATSITAWHFLHISGTTQTGYRILAWYHAST